MTQPSISGSGNGTRPTTSGGVDNIGGGERLSSKRTAAGGEVSSPLPQERMRSKRKDVESTKHDDSAPFGLHEHLEQQPNPDPGNSQAPSGKQR